MLESKLDGFTGKLVRGALAVYCAVVMQGCPSAYEMDDKGDTLKKCCEKLKCKEKGYDYCVKNSEKYFGDKKFIECICECFPLVLDSKIDKYDTNRLRMEPK